MRYTFLCSPYDSGALLLCLKEWKHPVPGQECTQRHYGMPLSAVVITVQDQENCVLSFPGGLENESHM